MRVKVQLKSDGVLVPAEYNSHLQGVFYRAVEMSDWELGYNLHERGFVSDGKNYKMFTFSFLMFEKREFRENDLWVRGKGMWFVSSPFVDLVEKFSSGILKMDYLKVGKGKIEIVGIERVDDCVSGSSLEFRTLSPVVVSTGIVDEGGSGKKKMRKVYLFPGDDRYDEILSENLRRKAKVLGIDAEGEVRVVDGKWKTKVRKIGKIRAKGIWGRFRVEGDEELIKVGYWAGFGEGNSQGFGMVEVV